MKSNPAGGIVFFDGTTVLLGTFGVNQTARPVRLVGYKVDGAKYCVTTDRYDLSTEQVAMATSFAGTSRLFSAGGSGICTSIT